MKYRVGALLPTLVTLIVSNQSRAVTVSSIAPRQLDMRVEAVDITLYPQMGWVREIRRQLVTTDTEDVTLAGVPRIEMGTPEVRAIDDGMFQVLGLDYTERDPSGTRLGSATAHVESEAGDRVLELSYVSSQLMWQASYVVTLPADGNQARLVASAQLHNRTGRTFENASIRLVSGVASDHSGTDDQSEVQGGLPEPPSSGPLLELKGFDLAPATVRDGDRKQVEFMTAPAVPVRIEHAVTFSASCTERVAHAGDQTRISVVFRNDKASGLGGHLAHGPVRVLLEGAGGSRTLVGRGDLGETAPDELVHIFVGVEKDVLATRTQIAYDGDRRSNEHERTYKVVLRNRKATAVIVTVSDYGGESIVRSSQAFTDSRGPAATCNVAVPAGGSSEVIYTVRYRCN